MRCGYLPERVLDREVAKVWQDRAVHERVQILADHHYTPRRRYRPRDGRGLAKTFRLFSAVTQLEWPIQGLTMAQTNHPAAVTIRLQSHSAVIHQICLRNRRIPAGRRQLKRERRPGPFPGLHVGDRKSTRLNSSHGYI